MMIRPLPPSNDVHGVRHDAPAGHGASDNTEFVCGDFPAILSSRWSSDPRQGGGQHASSGDGSSIIMAALSRQIDKDPIAKSSLLLPPMLAATSSSSAP
jgi:hypothetical protein